MTNKKVVIIGSASLQKELAIWVRHWNRQPYHAVINYPRRIPAAKFAQDYPKAHIAFFKDMKRADVIFLANEKKNDIPGYIGAESFAELCFAVMEKLISKRKITILLAHIPSRHVPSYQEIHRWLHLGWIDGIL